MQPEWLVINLHFELCSHSDAVTVWQGQLGQVSIPGEAERGGAAARGAWNWAGPQRRAAPAPRRVS